MQRGETPLQSAGRRAAFKEDISACSAGLARGVLTRLMAERIREDPEILRWVFDNLVKHVLSFEVTPAAWYVQDGAAIEDLGGEPAAYMLRLEQVLIDHLPAGAVSDFDGETVYHVARAAFDEVLRGPIAGGAGAEHESSSRRSGPDPMPDQRRCSL